MPIIVGVEFRNSQQIQVGEGENEVTVMALITVVYPRFEFQIINRIEKIYFFSARMKIFLSSLQVVELVYFMNIEPNVLA